jgi:hypothetical protein
MSVADVSESTSGEEQAAGPIMVLVACCQGMIGNDIYVALLSEHQPLLVLLRWFVSFFPASCINCCTVTALARSRSERGA